MLEVKTLGFNALMQKLDKHKVRVQKNIVKAKVSLATKVFNSVVEGSPQWSGNLAANWKIEVDGLGASYSPISNYKPDDWGSSSIYERGHPLAIGYALPELQRLASVQWNSKIGVSNSTPYADEVEAGQGPDGRLLRPENYRYGQIAMVWYAMAKFGKLTNTVKKI